jgi:predicted O-linked N-acetylglucosamine transferase (SPINDLY family)
MRPRCEPDFLAAAFDECAQAVMTLPFDLAAARQAVAHAELDVLFYPDIGMDIFTYYLAFARLARVQFTTWGHPVTTGIPNVDYYLSTRHAEPPDAQRFYSERLVEMENPPSFYYRPRPPSSFDIRAHLGAGPDERVYASTQTLYKIHPDFDDALVEILRRDRRGRVVLIASPRAGWNEKLRRRLERAGPDVASRIHLMPSVSLPDYLAALGTADALLDTFHFGGGCSSYESFGMSAPVVTLPGERMRARITAALYARMGQSRWVASSVDGFVNLALELANASDAQKQAWKREIADGAGAFLENDAVIREYEEFIAAAVAAGAAS